MNYIGIDIGDGESCVCLLPENSSLEPRPISITGRKSFLSAVAERDDGRILIGMDAVSAVGTHDFSIRFKSRFLKGSDADLRDMQRFLTGIHDHLVAQNLLTPDDKIVLGCPAGWNQDTRTRYLQMIKSAGFENPRLVSESRAAFLYAKHAKTIQLAPELIDSSALVIDIGSSTLDFAYVVDGHESNVGTFGDVYLGGGAIDEALLNAAVDASPQKSAILQTFKEAPEWKSYCLLAARRVKEAFFTQQSEGKENVRCSEMPVILYDMPIQLTIQANEQMIWRVVNLGIKALGNASFFRILENALADANQKTLARPPQLVLMTGGASRMKFFQGQCARTFPDALLVLCDEPEYSIAKGLAYAAKVDEEIFGFNAAISAFLQKGRIAEETDAYMPVTANALTDTITDIAFIQIKNMIERWRTGDFATLDDMNRAMPQELKKAMETPMLRSSITGLIQSHIKHVCLSLQPDIDDICTVYHVARSQMQLVQTDFIPTNAIHHSVDLRDGLPQLTKAVQGIITALVAGVMLLIPGSQILDLVIIAIAAVTVMLGKSYISDITSSINIPLFIRKQLSVDKIATADMRQKLHDQFQTQLGDNAALLEHISSVINASISSHIQRMAQKTEIAISSGDDT